MIDQVRKAARQVEARERERSARSARGAEGAEASRAAPSTSQQYLLRWHARRGDAAVAASQQLVAAITSRQGGSVPKSQDLHSFESGSCLWAVQTRSGEGCCAFSF